MKFLCLLIVACISQSYSLRNSDYSRYFETPAGSEFNSRDARRSRDVDRQPSPTISILSQFASPYIRPRSRSLGPQSLPLQRESRRPSQSYSSRQEKRILSNSQTRYSKPSFHFGNDPLEEDSRDNRFFSSVEESSRPSSSFIPVDSWTRPSIYSPKEETNYDNFDYKDNFSAEDDPLLYLDEPAFEIDDPMYLVEEEKEIPKKKNRPVSYHQSEVSSFKKPVYPQRPRNQLIDDQYSRIPQREYSNRLQAENSNNYNRDYPKMTQLKYEKTPPRVVPQKNTDKKFSEVYQREMEREISKTPQWISLKPDSKLPGASQSVRRTPQTTSRHRPLHINKSPEALRPVYQSYPLPKNTEIIKKVNSPKYPEVSTPKRILRKKPTLSRFPPVAKNEKKEKRQAHQGEHLDSNGVQFVSQANKVQKSAGDGRITFQIHGHRGPHSYKFGYDTGKGPNRQFRYEERDNYGEVNGHYGYYDTDGKLKVVNYEAHPEGGFKVHKN